MKNRNGITLIALVITIIVLLVLARISYDAIAGENGILTQAMSASRRTKNEGAKEEIQLAWSARMKKFYEDINNGVAIDDSYLVELVADLNEALGGSGKVKGIKYNEEKSQYEMLYQSNSANENFIMAVQPNGETEIIEENVKEEEKVSSYEVVADMIYAFYYEDDKILALSSLNKGIEGKTATASWDTKDNPSFGTSRPWDSYKRNIEKVVILNKIYPTSTKSWFTDFYNLTGIEKVENLITRNVTDMYSMFENCGSLESIELSSFDTSNVLRMKRMFRGSYSLTELDLSSFNTSKVTDFERMFSHCIGLRTIKIDSFDLMSATTATAMFELCESLTRVDLKNASNLKTICFVNGCSSLTEITFQNFNTLNATDVGLMFVGCSSLTTVDLTEFDTSNVTAMYSAFENCTNLTKIYISEKWDMSSVTGMADMFTGCGTTGFYYKAGTTLSTGETLTEDRFVTPSELGAPV